MDKIIKLAVQFIGAEYKIKTEDIEMSEEDFKEKSYRINISDDDIYSSICREQHLDQTIKKILNKRILHLMNQKSLIDSQIKELLYAKGQYIKITKNIYREV